MIPSNYVTKLVILSPNMILYEDRTAMMMIIQSNYVICPVFTYSIYFAKSEEVLKNSKLVSRVNY